MKMVKELLRQYLHERMMIEAEAMNHFNDRVSEVLYKNNRENLKSELCQLCFEELKKFLKSGQETIRR